MRRERDYILLFSCFEKRSRLWKNNSHGRARKNEADSHEDSWDQEFLLNSAIWTTAFTVFPAQLAQTQLEQWQVCLNIYIVSLEHHGNRLYMALSDFGAKCWMGDGVECTPLLTVMTTKAPTVLTKGSRK